MDKLKEKILSSYKYNPVSGDITGPSGKVVGSINNNGYLVINVKADGKTRLLRAHRMAWLLHYKVWPRNDIDHVNGIRTDNRIENLRDVSRRENCCNQEIHRNGKQPGLKLDSNGYWIVSIYHNGKNKFIGRYKSYKLAVNAYNVYKEDNGLE